MAKAASVTILFAFSITVSLAAGVAVSQAGLLDNIFKDGQKPLINGTILTDDNKTYYILVTPYNATIPTPVPVEQPNKPPFIEVSTPINSTVGKLVEIFAEVSDPDGNVTNIIWKQEGGEVVEFTANGSRLSFTPEEPDAYKFTIEAQDNKNASTIRPVDVIITKPGEPVPVPPPAPVPAPTPQPQPTPAPTDFKYIAVGDVLDTSAGKAVFNQVKASKPNLISGLGDLATYDGKDGSWFINTYGSLGNLIICQVGNHDDGKSKIENYCRDYSYYQKLGKYLIFGINTDGDLVKQGNEIVALLKNAQFMTGITDVFFNSHKFYATPPTDEHKVETDVKAMFDKINAAVPATVQDEYYVAGHNHFMAYGIVNGDEHFISGAGGRSHYDCSTNTLWKFCNDSSYGFLEFILKADGTVKAQFKDYNGKVLLG